MTWVIVGVFEARLPSTIRLLDVEADAARRPWRIVPVEVRAGALVDAAGRLGLRYWRTRFEALVAA